MKKREKKCDSKQNAPTQFQNITMDKKKVNSGKQENDTIISYDYIT